MWESPTLFPSPLDKHHSLPDVEPIVLGKGPEGTAWSCVREETGWVLGKGSSLEGGGHSPELLEFEECLDNDLIGFG